jgi:hypothetical protein
MGDGEQSNRTQTSRGSGGGPRVVVVGGGIAGLTTALRLAERGCTVRLLESKPMLGGNLASRPAGEGHHLDVYPHMFQAWYTNFWELMKAVKVDLGEAFTPFSRVSQAQPMENERMRLEGLTRPYSATYLLPNLFSGVAPPADMFLFGYASLDLQAEKRNPTLDLENVSLTGYLSSRVYMTDTALEAYEAFVLRVWGLPAYMISAADCQSYASYCYGAADEDGFLSTGSAHARVITPIRSALVRHRATPEEGWKVTRVSLEPDGDGGYRVAELEALVSQQGEEPNHAPPWFERPSIHGVPEPIPSPVEPKVEVLRNGEHFDAVVLAVPPKVLSGLVLGQAGDAVNARSGTNVSAMAEAKPRIVDALPELAELSRVGAQGIPVLHLFLTTTPEDLPADPVALNGSRLSLAFTAISKLWTSWERGQVHSPVQGADGPATVLALSCSEPLLLKGPTLGDDAYAMIAELSEYVPFDPGRGWGDGGEVDWDSTQYDSNVTAQLSLNTVGSDKWRPQACYPAVSNLYFAGDYCQHEFGITTLEAAVATGLKAAEAVVDAYGLTTAVEFAKHKLLPPEEFVGMRYAWLASAFAAMGWSRLTGGFGGKTERDNHETDDPFEELATCSTVRYLLTPGLSARKRRAAP